jgi:hypothetical protein
MAEEQRARERAALMADLKAKAEASRREREAAEREAAAERERAEAERRAMEERKAAKVCENSGFAWARFGGGVGCERGFGRGERSPGEPDADGLTQKEVMVHATPYCHARACAGCRGCRSSAGDGGPVARDRAGRSAAGSGPPGRVADLEGLEGLPGRAGAGRATHGRRGDPGVNEGRGVGAGNSPRDWVWMPEPGIDTTGLDVNA